MEECPDCEKAPHNPKTGFCWKSKSQNPRSGFHCEFCCKLAASQRRDEK